MKQLVMVTALYAAVPVELPRPACASVLGHIVKLVDDGVLRVVDQLERRHPDYLGLNLTREVRESLLKHEKDEDWPDEFRPKARQALLEAQVVDLADSTACISSLTFLNWRSISRSKVSIFVSTRLTASDRNEAKLC